MSGVKKPPDPEMIRRLRLGELKRILRDRYGHTLPDDDAGRADLHELLLPVSLGLKSPDRIMRNIIETWAPWMEASESYVLIQLIERTPPDERKRTSKHLGELLNLTNVDRERLKLRTIEAADLTDEQRAEYRKSRRRLMQRRWAQRKRNRAGRSSFPAMLAVRSHGKRQA